jgi:hypothetical protein
VDRQAANVAERFDPEGCKSPGGEWRRWARQAEPRSGSCNGPEAWKPPQPGETGRGSGAEGPNGQWNELGRARSSRLGALTPEWRSPRGGSYCGRAKSRYERSGSGQKAASGEPGSIDPGAGENGLWGAERRIVRRFCLRCSMPATSTA